MRVLITGANGFLGKNLKLRLSERKDLEIISFTRDNQISDLTKLLKGVNFVFHLAGINRPQNSEEFELGNTDLTRSLCNALVTCKQKISVIYASSTQAAYENLYGLSKRNAENILRNLQLNHQHSVHIFRLPNLFGKWGKPNYNSVVTTFCHNIAHDLPIKINDPDAVLTLSYVEDVISRFIQLMDGAIESLDSEGFEIVAPQYVTTVGELARQIQLFKDSRLNLLSERVGTGFIRALYSTYLSYVPPEKFTYLITQYTDARGAFVEMLKTPDCGQFSYFTAYPGVTRGRHYHNSKTEKFLVIKGEARFKFRHMSTEEIYELVTNGDKAEIVETMPGWTHDVTNIGTDELIVMLWANEVFDRLNPDTYTATLESGK